MNKTGDLEEHTDYACHCLNVRIKAFPNDKTPPPELAPNSQYSPVYVRDESITIANPQITLRIRTQGAPIAGTSQCSRYISLHCLICETPVYRVYQVIPIDSESDGGPILPTEEWVEDEIMKSASGWVQIHKDCLTGEYIIRAQSSPAYSTTFSLVLPPQSTTAIPRQIPPRANHESLLWTPSIPPIPETSVPPSTPPHYLPEQRQLFPPPPFTPSHSVFVHLSSVASKRSQEIRVQAELYLAEIVRQKTAEVEQVEDELREEVETLWKKFKTGISKIEEAQHHPVTQPTTSTKYRDRENWSGPTSPTGYGTPVKIRDFVPQHISSARAVSPVSTNHRISSLSASLATSSFHHPKERQAQSSPPRNNRPKVPSVSTEASSHGSSSNRTLSSHSLTSSMSLPGYPPAEGTSSVLQFRRNTNDAINTAASFRYFVNIEAEMARNAREQQKDASKKPEARPTSSELPRQNNGSLERTAPITNGHSKHHKKSFSESQITVEGPTSLKAAKAETVAQEASGSRGRNNTKGKRKVTFDVNPDIVTIKREVDAEKAEEEALASHEIGEMVFDLEDEDSERSVSEMPSRLVLPLIEHNTPLRPPRSRTDTHSMGISQSFSVLQPIPPPGPSHIRVSGLSQSAPRYSPPLDDQRPSKSLSNPAEPELPTDREQEILKLVAADTPSHRGAWKRDSKAWNSFIRQKDYTHSDGPIPEEGEYDDSLDTIHGDEDDESLSDGNEEAPSPHLPGTAGSLPIPIAMHPRMPRVHEKLSLASYQPKTSLADRPGIIVPALRRPGGIGSPLASSTTIRKAIYAERDRLRSMDPGALDFAAEEDDDVGEDTEDETNDIPVGRGQKKALRILQKRSKIPAAGMWRSLA